MAFLLEICAKTLMLGFLTLSKLPHKPQSPRNSFSLRCGCNVVSRASSLTALLTSLSKCLNQIYAVAQL